MSGRPRKPTAIKVAEGNRGRRPLNRREMVEEPEAPVCPEWLDAVAREEWARISRQLLEMRVLRPADQTELAVLAGAVGTLRAARKQFEALPEDKRLLIVAPNKTLQQNPLIAIINRQAEVIHRIASQFGLTPASRAQLLTDEPAPAGKTTLADLLRGPAEHRADDPVN